MLNLDEDQIPDFEFTHGGQVLRYDGVKLAYALRSLEKAAEDPEAIRETISKALGIDLSCFAALLVGVEFKKYIEENQLFEKLKNILGPELFSSITSDSIPTVTGQTPAEPTATDVP